MSINSNTEYSVPNHPSSIVSHIRDLLPKHAVFHAKLVIHQLQSVPLVSGEFKIKWKFHHLQAVNRAGRPLGLGRALVLKLDGQKKRHVESINVNGSEKAKGKGKEVVHSRDEDDFQAQELDMSTLSLPKFPDGLPRSTHTTRPPSKQSTSSSNSTTNSISNSTSHVNSILDPPMSEDLGIDYRTEAKGHTPYLPLRDFKVEFESEINVAVQMSIERDTIALQASELKLTVIQRVIPNDPESPVNPRLGHVEVNLAEYVDAGSVTRTYLLRRSKVNAMLNMTITMTQISGEERYRAPPLRKEEIKAGISDFLSASKVPLPSLSRHMAVDDPWLSSSLGQFVKLDEDGMLIPQVDEPEEIAESSFELQNPPRHRKRWRVGTGKRGSGSQSKTLDPAVPSAPKIVDPSSQKEQLHPTEALIEAIFNPFPCTLDTVSPFTYFVPPAPTPKTELRQQGSCASEGNGTDGTSRGSFDSSLRTTASASASVSDQGYEGETSSESVSGYKWWRRKIGSRPVTPSPMDSTRS